MKHVLLSAALLATVFAAAPAAADCTPIEASGGSVCATVDYLYVDASADQPGAGGAAVTVYQFTVWGTTLTAEGVSVYTDAAGGSDRVSASHYCWDTDDVPDCELDETGVESDTRVTGYDFLYVDAADGVRVCMEGDNLGEYECAQLA